MSVYIPTVKYDHDNLPGKICRTNILTEHVEIAMFVTFFFMSSPFTMLWLKCHNVANNLEIFPETVD